MRKFNSPINIVVLTFSLLFWGAIIAAYYLAKGKS